MKDKFAIAALAAVILAMALVASVLAGSAFSNTRADFVVFQNRNNIDAGAYAVFNYAKGVDKWNITLEGWNLQPGHYYLSVGTAGSGSGNTEVAEMTVDESGSASVHAMAGNLPDTFNIARLYRVRVLTELTAPESGGNLKFRGGKRGK